MKFNCIVLADKKLCTKGTQECISHSRVNLICTDKKCQADGSDRWSSAGARTITVTFVYALYKYLICCFLRSMYITFYAIETSLFPQRNARSCGADIAYTHTHTRHIWLAGITLGAQSRALSHFCSAFTCAQFTASRHYPYDFHTHSEWNIAYLPYNRIPNRFWHKYARDGFLLFLWCWGGFFVNGAAPAGAIISGSLQLFHLEKCN